MAYLRGYFKDRENKKLIAAVLMLNLFTTMFILNYINNDTDILWHFKVGQEIVESRTISFVNNFTFQSGTYWNQHEWLFDILIYLVINYTGMLGFIAIKYILEIITMFTCMAIAKPKNGALWICVYTILRLVIPCSFANRPAEYSIICLVVALWAFSTTSHTFRTRAWFMCITGLIVANIHGGLVGTILCLLFIGYISDRLSDAKYKIKNLARTKEKAKLLLIFLVSSAINPTGINIWLYPLYVSNLRSTDYILEWKQFDFGIISSILIIYLFISLGYSVHKRNFSSDVVRTTVWICGLGVLSLMTSRSIAILFYVWITFDCQYSTDIICDYAKGMFGRSKKSKTLHRTLSIVTWSVVELTSLILVLMQLLTVKYVDFETYADRGVSNKILDTLESRYRDSDKILAGYSVNNNILFRGMKVFVDTRQTPYDTYDNESLIELIELSEGKDRERCDKIIEHYKFDYIWTSEELNLGWYLKDNDRYRLILSDEQLDEKLYTRI